MAPSFVDTTGLGLNDTEIPIGLKLDLILCQTSLYKYKCPICELTIINSSDDDMPLGHVECDCGVKHLVPDSMVWH